MITYKAHDLASHEVQRRGDCTNNRCGSGATEGSMRRCHDERKEERTMRALMQIGIAIVLCFDFVVAWAILSTMEPGE